jgi:hypothetical protein
MFQGQVCSKGQRVRNASGSFVVLHRLEHVGSTIGHKLMDGVLAVVLIHLQRGTLTKSFNISIVLNNTWGPVRKLFPRTGARRRQRMHLALNKERDAQQGNTQICITYKKAVVPGS